MLQRISNEGGLVRVHAMGRLDSAVIATHRAGLEALCGHAAGDVVLDLREVSFIDGSAVAAIGMLHRRLRAAGHRLRLSGAGGRPEQLLRGLGLLWLLEDAVSGARLRRVESERAWARMVMRDAGV